MGVTLGTVGGATDFHRGVLKWYRRRELTEGDVWPVQPQNTSCPSAFSEVLSSVFPQSDLTIGVIPR